MSYGTVAREDEGVSPCPREREDSERKRESLPFPGEGEGLQRENGLFHREGFMLGKGNCSRLAPREG